MERDRRGATFSDAGDDPDYLQAPPVQQSVFQTAADWPSVVGYYQQRRGFADTTSDPERVWMSRTGSYSSFTTSTPLQDDDAVSFRLAGRQVNAVRHLIDLDRLYLLTTGGIHKVEGDDSGRAPPGGDQPAPGGVQRVVLARADHHHVGRALRTGARGRGARLPPGRLRRGAEPRPDHLRQSHLFDGYSLVDWAYQETPNSIVWAVRSDGVLLGLTYLREHEVWGWHHHDTDGVVENVCVVPEGIEDRLYLVVRRTINGVTKRFIERMHSRAITAADRRPRPGVSWTPRSATTGGTRTAAHGVRRHGWDDGRDAHSSRPARPSSVLGDVGNAFFFYDDDGD
jgi:hypothetical protein